MSEKDTEKKDNDRKLTRKDFVLNRKPIPISYNFASDVKKHGKTSYTQNFATYNDIYGAEDVDYDLIDGLYHSTILNRVIKKIASDAVPEMFKIQIVDLEGERLPELEQQVMVYLAHLKRKHINQMFNYTMRYGTGFLYIGNKQEEQLVNMFCLHPKDIKPVMDESTGEIKEWTYTTQDGEITIPDEDILRFPYDADIGEVYGMSFIGKLVQTLHLMLNTELNLAEIVDKYAIPILQWLVEVGDDEEVEDDELYEIFQSIQDQFEYSNDVITTDRITESFGLLTFPMSIIGGKSDNLSSIKVQAAQYTNDLQDLQMCFADELVEQVIEPFLSANGQEAGINYANIYIIFPVLTTESNADTSIWLFPAIRMGLINRDEARAQLKFRGKAMKLEEIEFIDPTATYLQEQALEQQQADPDEAKIKDGRGDPESKE